MGEGSFPILKGHKAHPERVQIANLAWLVATLTARHLSYQACGSYVKQNMSSSASETPLGFIRPELPILVSEPPTGEGWVHEIEYDGYRILVVMDRDRIRAFSRNGNDWSRTLPTGGRGLRQAPLQGGADGRRNHHPGRKWDFRL
jgi:ATP-dependent DNA ligase